MAPPALSATNRFIAQGTTRYYWLPTCASIALPTRIEMNAGTDLTCEIASISGFSTMADEVETPDACSRFTSKIPGPIKADDSSINFYADVTGNDVHSFYVRDQNGFLLILPGGDIAGRRMDNFATRVKSISRVQSLADSQQIVVGFSITRDPALNILVPA